MSSPKRASYDDLRRVPDTLVAEIVDGVLYTSPRPASPHARATAAIMIDLGPCDGEPRRPSDPGGWWILMEPELHFRDEVLVPDLAGWRRERMPAVPNVAYFELAPDWICEVVSPRTGGLDRARKMPVYAREKVEHAWLVDPIARTLEVYRLEAKRWWSAGTHGGDDRVRVPPFVELEVELGRWWLESAGEEGPPDQALGVRQSGAMPGRYSSLPVGARDVVASRGVSLPKRATYDDLRRVPETLVAEIVDGVLYTSPRPASPHARATAAITRALGPFDDDGPGMPSEPGGWWILIEPELHFRDEVLVPDLAGWRRARMPKMPNVAYFELAPDWICEVVSPRTGGLDRARKMPVYAREKVEHAWLVDPIARTLEGYRLEGTRWWAAGTHGGNDRVRVPPFVELEVELGRWWLDVETEGP